MFFLLQLRSLDTAEILFLSLVEGAFQITIEKPQ